jgi:hypothetical protein
MTAASSINRGSTGLSSALTISMFAFALSVTTSLAFASSKTGNTTIGYTVKVLNPSNSPEAYSTTAGLVQWRVGLPIPAADTIEVDATVVSGTDNIVGLAAKLDGKSLTTVKTAPWAQVVSVSPLPLGNHKLEVTTNLSQRDIIAILPLNFTVVQTLPAALIPPLTAVKGTQQVLSQGNVSSIDPTNAPIVPPVVTTTAQVSSSPGVDISFLDNNATTQRKSGFPVDVNGSLTVIPTLESGSPDKSFVFSIVRDGVVVYSSSALTPIVGTGISIQARTTDKPGLLPGVVQLYVWGVDDSGNYGIPTIVSFSINSPG